MTIAIILGVVAVVAIFFVATYNGLVKAKTLVEEGFSGMDVFLKKRYDIIPNLVETVKGYTEHESQTLSEVVEARGAALSGVGGDISTRASNEVALGSALGKLFAVAEQYPNLKANSVFIEFQQQLEDIENDISQSRQYYNGAVRGYNIKTKVMPSAIVASMFGFKELPFFELSSEKERENISVSF